MSNTERPFQTTGDVVEAEPIAPTPQPVPEKQSEPEETNNRFIQPINNIGPFSYSDK